MSQKWPSPPGFGPVRPLDRVQHKGLGLSSGAYGFARELPAIRITIGEFFSASRDYPIVFARNGEDQPLLTMIILGLESHENIFVDAQGGWRAPHYVPSFVRSYPFCLVRLRSEQESSQGTSQRIVCVDEAGLTASERPFIDTRGNDTPSWQYINRLLMEMDDMSRRTHQFIGELEQRELLTPMKVRGSTSMQMFRIDENRLNELEPELLQSWLKGGMLRLIHAHLLSLDNFNRMGQLKKKWGEEQA
uniref:SapC family protein n=1 Tax=Magnetococcus massalia (strain MO-1) TaxID=451514 RepID=A0A1S7LL84_MAGMO|nr:conserved protein of unknown function [include a SapC domain] [Candidatus Magnetococcus massalia]